MRNVAGKAMMVALMALYASIVMQGWAVAGEPAEIEMMDGSIIRAEVLSLHDGVFTIRSDTLGTLDIVQSRVRSIRQGPFGRVLENSAPQTSGLSASAEQIKTLAQAMTADRDIMDRISLLSGDPDILDAIQDPGMPPRSCRTASSSKS